VAVPEDPSRARVSLMEGMTFSVRPRTNWISAGRAVEEEEEERRCWVFGSWGAKAEEREGMARRRMVRRDIMVEFELLLC